MPTSNSSTEGPTQPPIQWVPDVKQQGREADHSPATSVDVNGGTIHPPPIRLRGVVIS
jgi:hypothetical protein